MNKFSYMKMMGEFMMNTDTYTADNWLNHTMPNVENTYVRMQIPSLIGMDKIDPVSIEGLKQNGHDLWSQNQPKIEKILRAIVDEKMGKVKGAWMKWKHFWVNN